MILAIETGIEPEYEQALINSAKKYGWTVYVVRHIPFTDEFDDLPTGLAERTDVFFHGDIMGAKAAQKTTKWQVHAPWDQMTVWEYGEYLLELMVNNDFIPVTLSFLEEGGAARIARASRMLQGDGETLFIKPSGVDKIFTGMVVHASQWDAALRTIKFYEPPPTTELIIAKPQYISSEARFLVVDGKIVTGSYYRINQQSIRLEVEPSQELWNVACNLLAKCITLGYNPAPSWVLDLALVEDQWKVLEVGPSSCCGLYKCNTDAFIEALTELFNSSGTNHD